MGRKYHLSFFNKVKCVCGLSRQDELPYKNPIFVKLYPLWGYFFAFAYLGNFTLLLIRLYLEMNNPVVVAQSLSFSCLYVVTIFSLRKILSKEVQDLFTSIETMEQDYLKNANSRVKKVFEKYIVVTNKTAAEIFYFTYVFCICLSLEHSKLLEGRKEYVYFQWFPFNPDDYYWFVLFDQCFYLMTCYLYMMYTKFSVLHISTYVLANIKVLQTIITDSEYYSNYIKNLENVSIDEARYIVFSKFVVYHTDLIQ